MNMPPDECPNDGICLTVLPRIRAIEDDVKVLKACAQKVASIEVVMSERDKAGTKIWNAMLCLLGLSVVHFAAFLIWVGSTTERLTAFKEANARQDEQITRIERMGK